MLNSLKLYSQARSAKCLANLSARNTHFSPSSPRIQSTSFLLLQNGATPSCTRSYAARSSRMKKRSNNQNDEAKQQDQLNQMQQFQKMMGASSKPKPTTEAGTNDRSGTDKPAQKQSSDGSRVASGNKTNSNPKASEPRNSRNNNNTRNNTSSKPRDKATANTESADGSTPNRQNKQNKKTSSAAQQAWDKKKKTSKQNTQPENVDEPPKPKVKEVKQLEAVKPTLTIPKFISLVNFATVLNIKFPKLVKLMKEMGFTELSYDHIIDEEIAGLVAEELGFNVVMDDSLGADLFPAPAPKDLSKVPMRPPIVTIMGHVDHGKTTILDYLRKASVAASEHGGITQHIGAFSVEMSDQKQICFLDTPGHAAFLNMRERGANVTDIVVLVVAADDSVMPQTKEAIKHAKTAGVPIIVAINKMDKPDANPEKVIADLSANGVDVEDYGGETQTVKVSGKTGKGIDELEEAIITLSELLELKAPKDGNSEGWVVESQIKKGHGSSATVLVRRGTLNVGSFIVAGNTWCKVRSMRNSAGIIVKSAGPGTPVEVTGWKELPQAGDEMLQADNEAIAKKVVENRITREKLTKSAADVSIINEQRKLMRLEQDKEAKRQERIKMGLPADPESEGVNEESGEKQDGPIVIPFIIKADVSGSAEAVADSIQGLGNGEVQSSVLYKGVGGVNENDIVRAEAAGATILTFNVNTDREIAHSIQLKNIPFMEHRIIYKLLESVTEQLASKLPPEIKHKVLGEATIKEIFNISLKRSKTLNVAGTRVSNGIISRSAKVKVLRNNNVVYTGTFSSLKHFKEEVNEIKKDTDCGIAFNNWQDFQPGDVIQTYEEIIIPRHF